MPEASGLTNEMLCRMACWDSVPLYLQPGEVKEDLLKKHGGDVVSLIQFLRKRAFKEIEIEQISERIEKKVEKAMQEKKSSKKKPANKSSGNQEALF